MNEHFLCICFLDLLASVKDGSWPCFVGLSVNVCSEPLVIGRRGEISTAKRLAADNGRQQSSKEVSCSESGVREYRSDCVIFLKNDLVV